MSALPNPFAALLDPVAVLSSCAASRELTALPVSAKRSADRPSSLCNERQRAHDNAIDALFADAGHQIGGQARQDLIAGPVAAMRADRQRSRRR